VAEDQTQRYRVVEPTFEVVGDGTPIDALAYFLNAQAAEGYRLLTTVRVRQARADGRVSTEAVDALVFERIAE
jgi:hypothetical protein